MARPFGEQREQDQLQFARGELAAGAESRAAEAGSAEETAGEAAETVPAAHAAAAHGVAEIVRDALEMLLKPVMEKVMHGYSPYVVNYILRYVFTMSTTSEQN